MEMYLSVFKGLLMPIVVGHRVGGTRKAEILPVDNKYPYP